MTTLRSIGLRIGGAARPASDDSWAIRRNPVSGEAVTRSAAATPADADAAVDAAASAFPAWSELGPTARRGILLKAADLLEARPRLRFRHGGADRVGERSNNRRRSS